MDKKELIDNNKKFKIMYNLNVARLIRLHFITLLNLNFMGVISDEDLDWFSCIQYHYGTDYESCCVITYLDIRSYEQNKFSKVVGEDK